MDDGVGDGASCEADGSTPPGADQVPVGSGAGLVARPEPEGPDPGCPAPAAAGDPPCSTAAWDGVTAGAWTLSPGARAGPPVSRDADGAAPAAAGGRPGRGLNRTVTVTKRAVADDDRRDQGGQGR